MKFLRFLKTSWSWLLGAIFFVPLTFFCARVVVVNITTTIPDPVRVAINAPADAEVMEAKDVEHTTFKLNLSLSEWQEKYARGEHPEKPLVTWHSDGRLEYWLARRDGTFYYARQNPDAFRDASGDWEIGARRDGQNLVLTASRNSIKIFALSAFLLLSVTLSLLFVAALKDSWDEA